MIIKNLNRYSIILASQSPRRQKLLKELGLSFKVVVKDWPETWPENLDGEEIAMYVAQVKANLLKHELKDNGIVIAADTLVWCNNSVLGKPAGYEDAKAMLRAISGNTHEVITGVCLLSPVRGNTFAVSTKVTFEELSDQEIDYYIDNYKPYDKAGAYGIQEWIGYIACSHIEGSYFNVMGLPVQKLYRELHYFVNPKPDIK